MKKILSFVMAVMVVSLTFAADRQHTLKVYNWADYINEDVLKSFPQWYYEQTGEKVEVIYQTFDINESMLTQIEVGHEDYDVICPSEYIIERMLKLNLLQPIKKDLVNEDISYFYNVAPFVVEKFSQMSQTVDVSDYAVGYMWGTTGFLYNADLVDVSDLQSWGALLNPKYEDKILVKDAFRDVYSVLVLYAYYDDILAGKVTRDELVTNITPERIAAVEKILTDAKQNIAGWEVDFGKEEMTKGKILLDLSWSGDAQWAIDETEGTDVNLKYIVPQEGSNVWFDGWCIPIYAKNPKAATYFIDYMCRPDNAIKNMEEIGYVSVIATPEVLEAMIDDELEETVDASYFFGEDGENVKLNPVFYPDKTVIERCALMHDAGDEAEELINMWNRVKGDNLSVGIIVFLVLVILVIIAFIVYRMVSSNKPQRRKRK